MAKGDQKSYQNQIDKQGSIMQNSQDKMMNNFYGSQGGFQNNYNQGSATNMNDYEGMMGNYNAFMQNPFSPNFNQQNGGAIYKPQGSAGHSMDHGGAAGSQNGGQLPQGGGNPNGGQLSTRDWVIQTANQLGKPEIANNPDYWVNEIDKVGGYGDGSYWSNKMVNPGGGGGGGGFGSYGGMGGGISPQAYGIYSQLGQNGGGFAWDPQFRGALGSAIGGYGDFANNGGFSPGDIQNMRARAIAPTRAVYANAQNDISRARGLQGGFSPNYTAAKAKMSRDLAYGISDANTNANAEIAQMQQQGRLAGLAGLSNTGLGAQGMENSIAGGNLNARLAGAGGMAGLDQYGAGLGLQADMFNRGLAEQRDEAGMNARLNALGGMNNLYGTAPGMAQLFGNQVLQGQQNLLAGQGSQNQIGSGQINAQFNKSQIPSNWDVALGRIGQGLGIAGQVAGGITGGFGGLLKKGSKVGAGGMNTPGSIANIGGTKVAPSMRGVRF